jgi:hypothetical protein
MRPDVFPLACLSLIVIEDTIVGGGRVGLSLLAFFVLGDDDGAGILPDIDDVVEVVVGVVAGISNILL